jgi:isocitrate/isopropylmalate dehydrogenase
MLPVRKVLGLYANVRPCVSYHPFVETKHPVMDVVVVRENEEDLYAGNRAPQTNQVVQCLKLISRPVQERSFATLRVRATKQPQEGHLLHERQHHEAD